MTLRSVRTAVWTAALLVLIAAPVRGQVRVETRTERGRYLQGEPIVVTVRIENVGDEAFGYCTCEGDIRLTVIGVQRRTLPNIYGCGGGGEGSGPGVGMIDHPPMLQPGESTAFRFLLQQYDLAPGRYSLRVSGRAGVRWKYYPWAFPLSGPKHKETDPVPGADVDQTLPFDVVPASEGELKQVFAPLVSDAESSDATVRREARAAIAESAPAFLLANIARFAADGEFGAIDALRRLASLESRNQLKTLFAAASNPARSAIALALARIGNSNDEAFLADVLRDGSIDESSRRNAAAGLGYIGGDAAAADLITVLPIASPSLTRSIVLALGNTRSTLAVPVLINLFATNLTGNDVCGSLQTMTRRNVCEDAWGDPASWKRKTRRWWNENQGTIKLYGPHDCAESAAEPPQASIVREPAPRSIERRVPILNAVRPRTAAPNTVVTLSGFALGLGDMRGVAVVFTQGDKELTGKYSGGMQEMSGGLNGNREEMDVVVPAAATVGRWQILIDVAGQRSAPVVLEVTESRPAVLTAVTPPRVHPSQLVFVTSRLPAERDDKVVLIDGRGTVWNLGAGVYQSSITFRLPDDVADGDATIRVGSVHGGVERFSAPLTFVVTSEPLPLRPMALSMMRSVAPGQWTDLVIGESDIEFEIRRADRIDIEFLQGDVSLIMQAAEPRHVHLQVPPTLAPGRLSVRTRTWIEQTASEWSSPVEYMASATPATASVDAIDNERLHELVWPLSNGARSVRIAPGDSLVLRGHFPVARLADLRVRLTRSAVVLDLATSDVDGAVRVEIPSDLSAGEWQLSIGPTDGSTRFSVITNVQVER